MLFRSEAVEFQHRRRAGSILLTRSIRYSRLALSLVVIAVLISAVALAQPVARKVKLVGVLVPQNGFGRVVAPTGGQVEAIARSEGQLVEKGQPLFTLVNERALQDGSAEVRLRQLFEERRAKNQRDFDRSRAGYIDRQTSANRRLEALRRETSDIRFSIALQNDRVTIAEGTLSSYRDLQSKEYISQAQVLQKQSELIEQRQRAAELGRALSINEREIETVQGELATLRDQFEKESAATTRLISENEQSLIQNEAEHRVSVLAPFSGRVSGILVEMGQSVKAEQPLGSVIPPDGPVVAELYAGSDTVGEVKVGSPVTVRFHSYPYQRFGQAEGVVFEVSAATLQPDQTNAPVLAATVAKNEAIYRLRVRLASSSFQSRNGPLPLLPGSTLDATVSLEKRRVYQWLLEPFFAWLEKL